MQVLFGRRQRKRIDREPVLLQSYRKISAAEELCEIFVAAAQVKDIGPRIVLLRMRKQKIEQKALAAAGGSENDRVGDIAVMQIQKVGRGVVRFQYCQIFRSAQMCVLRLTGAE